jgi:lipopolysaccharide biosynthesis glycosyltransferase
MPFIAGMPISRERLEKYRNRNLRQIEHASRQWEARESQVKNAALQKKWLDSQTAHNYHVEYDRIRNELAHRRMPWRTQHHLEQRAKELHKLFSSGNI